jgi:hypothetical protein
VPPRRAVLAGLVGAASTLAGCGLDGDGGPSDIPSPDRLSTPTGGPWRWPHIQPTGNRVVRGRGNVPEAAPVDIDLGLDRDPAWTVALSADEGVTEWVTADTSGSLVAHRVDEGGGSRVPVSPEFIRQGRPPTVTRDGEDALLVPQLPGAAAGFTSPLVLPDGRWAFVRDDGALVIRGPDGTRRVDVDAPPDAYPVRLGRLVVVLSEATDQYGHGALGDGTEAVGFAVVDPESGEVRTRAQVPADAVIEGLAPIVAPVTDGGDPAVVVTESDTETGARVVAYSPDGERLAAGPPVGSGFRWRHQLAVAPFAPDGVPELAAVKTPHIGGTAEFYRYDPTDETLRIVGAVEGVSSHTIGSRNLDGGVAADADGDGQPELVVPDDPRRALVGIRRTDSGAMAAWRVPVGGEVASNLYAVRTGDRVVVGVARADGVLRVWR